MLLSLVHIYLHLKGQTIYIYATFVLLIMYRSWQTVILLEIGYNC
jgi:hypothetical protein